MGYSTLDRVARTCYSPLCSRCHGPGMIVFPGGRQNEFDKCYHCCGTGVEPISWSELFPKGRAL